jgi:hypothetical protein
MVITPKGYHIVLKSMRPSLFFTSPHLTITAYYFDIFKKN